MTAGGIIMIKKNPSKEEIRPGKPAKQTDPNVCPVCGGKLIQEKCKVVCRSEKCVYRIIYNCSEF